MAHQQLIDSVSARFEELTGRKPIRLCLAPGRVNLIGEHIDYNGFGVLPCAVGRYTALAIGFSGDDDSKAISITTAGDKRNAFEVELSVVDSVPKERHHWSNYVLAAVLGLKEFGVTLPRGIQIVVGGDLPQACGLSSSSSLVVASAMALGSLRLTRQAIAPETLADICMKAEWHVGTAGGGMDQAAIILSKAGFANHIQFNPLKTTPVKLPHGVSFVVANSMARSAKAETAHKYFNKRVFECKLGQRLLRKSLFSNAEPDAVKDTFAAIQSDLGSPGVGELVAHCKRIIPRGAVSKRDVESLIGTDTLDYLLTGRWGRAVWDLNETFFILPRAIHVFTEADRVVELIAAGERGDTESMAALINESGRSLDEDYDCSCDELRKLTAAMRKAGCVAARLVGAGFGGSCVGMVPTPVVDSVIEAIRRDFYAHVGDQQDVSELCFAFEPANGAQLVELEHS